MICIWKWYKQCDHCSYYLHDAQNLQSPEWAGLVGHGANSIIDASGCTHPHTHRHTPMHTRTHTKHNSCYIVSWKHLVTCFNFSIFLLAIAVSQPCLINIKSRRIGVNSHCIKPAYTKSPWRHPMWPLQNVYMQDIGLHISQIIPSFNLPHEHFCDTKPNARASTSDKSNLVPRGNTHWNNTHSLKLITVDVIWKNLIVENIKPLAFLLK